MSSSPCPSRTQEPSRPAPPLLGISSLVFGDLDLLYPLRTHTIRVSTRDALALEQQFTGDRGSDILSLEATRWIALATGSAYGMEFRRDPYSPWNESSADQVLRSLPGVEQGWLGLLHTLAPEGEYGIQALRLFCDVLRRRGGAAAQPVLRHVALLLDGRSDDVVLACRDTLLAAWVNLDIEDVDATADGTEDGWQPSLFDDPDGMDDSEALVESWEDERRDVVDLGLDDREGGRYAPTPAHEEQDCAGPCPWHRPSQPLFGSSPLRVRRERDWPAVTEIRCAHRRWHPHPDSAEYLATLAPEESDDWTWTDLMLHDCDGCCAPSRE